MAKPENCPGCGRKAPDFDMWHVSCWRAHEKRNEVDPTDQHRYMSTEQLVGNPPPATQVESASAFILRLSRMYSQGVALNAVAIRDLAVRADERRQVLEEMGLVPPRPAQTTKESA